MFVTLLETKILGKHCGPSTVPSEPRVSSTPRAIYNVDEGVEHMKIINATSVLSMTIFLIPAFITSAQAQWLQHRTAGIPRTADGKPNLTAPAPRTGDGKPDLTGLWEFPVETAVGNIAMRNAGDLKTTDVQPWAQALVKQRSETLGKDNPRFKCLPEGPGYSTSGGVRKFLQMPGMIVILNEDLTYRQIYMDGRALETNPNPGWMGYSVGHWDKDTLVVESFGFNDRTWILDGYPHTEALRMTERFRRNDLGHLEVAITFQDPGAYSRAWTVAMHARLVVDSEMLESVCNENSSGQEHWVGNQNDAERTRVQVAPEILAKYAGVYKGPYIGGPRTVGVSFSGGTLFVSVNEGPKQPLVPQSETGFSGTGLTYQFVRDSNGVATHIIEGHVSGDYKYERQK